MNGNMFCNQKLQSLDSPYLTVTTENKEHKLAELKRNFCFQRIYDTKYYSDKLRNIDKIFILVKKYF